MPPGLSSLANWSNVTLFLSLFGADYFYQRRERLAIILIPGVLEGKDGRMGAKWHVLGGGGLLHF